MGIEPIAESIRGSCSLSVYIHELEAVCSSPLPSECACSIEGLDLRTKQLLSFIMAGGLLVAAGAFTGTLANQPAQESLSLPSNVAEGLPKQAVVRASVRLGKTHPERWFVAYDLKEQARIALFEGNMQTDDRVFEGDRSFGHKLSLQNLQSISVPEADASFLLSFEQVGDSAAKYFCVVTFRPGALDIKLFVNAVGGKAEVEDNPFCVRIWSKIAAAGAGSPPYEISEYRLPNKNATKFVKAQTNEQIQRPDSVTVSAGIPKEQLALEDRLNAIVGQGNQALRGGNASDAITQYESALELVQKQPLLAERKNYVLDRLANGYVQGNRAKDAIPIYSQLLDARSRDCESRSAALSNCADVQFSLGMAKLHAVDFEGALATLRDAESNYFKAEKVSESHEFSAIQVKEQAQTNLWIAVALFQLGKTEDATTTLEAAIA
jgi:hypothetical protein